MDILNTDLGAVVERLEERAAFHDAYHAQRLSTVRAGAAQAYDNGLSLDDGRTAFFEARDALIDSDPQDPTLDAIDPDFASNIDNAELLDGVDFEESDSVLRGYSQEEIDCIWEGEEGYNAQGFAIDSALDYA